MKLSDVERIILINQSRILAILDPDSAKSHELAAEALEGGYEGAYTWHLPSFDPEVLSAEECSETLNILTMFLVLKRTYDELEDKSGIDSREIEYEGFDGNNDKQHGFCFFLEKEGKFKDLNITRNSHSQGTLPMYRRMLAAWERCRDISSLAREDLQRILRARTGS